MLRQLFFIIILSLAASITGEDAIINVNDSNDSVDPDAEYCLSPNSTFNCNIRSAWLACLTMPTVSHCIIALPFQSTIYINTTKGYLTLLEGFNIVLSGTDSSVNALSPAHSSFILFYSTNLSEHSSLKILNVEINGFGTSTFDGGVMKISGHCALEMLNVKIYNSTGRFGGAIYISSTFENLINITNCILTHSYASKGGSLYLDTNVSNFIISRSEISHGIATSNGYYI